MGEVCGQAHRSYYIDKDVALILDLMWLKTGKNKSLLINEAVRAAYECSLNNHNWD